LHQRPAALKIDRVLIFVMALPKWSAMTDESKKMAKVGGIIGVSTVALLIVKTFPLLLVGGSGYLAYRYFKNGVNPK
tara:strand:- start:300 stop:530 length:231 start_codon:yes stop_codon:yes gene_type:complete